MVAYSQIIPSFISFTIFILSVSEPTPQPKNAYLTQNFGLDIVRILDGYFPDLTLIHRCFQDKASGKNRIPKHCEGLQLVLSKECPLDFQGIPPPNKNYTHAGRLLIQKYHSPGFYQNDPFSFTKERIRLALDAKAKLRNGETLDKISLDFIVSTCQNLPEFSPITGRLEINSKPEIKLHLLLDAYKISNLDQYQKQVLEAVDSLIKI